MERTNGLPGALVRTPLLCLSLLLTSNAWAQGSTSVLEEGVTLAKFRVASYNLRGGAGQENRKIGGDVRIGVGDFGISFGTPEIELPHFPSPLEATRDLNRIGAVLKANKIDIVGAQEAFGRSVRSGNVDQPRHLGGLLGHEHFFSESKSAGGGVLSKEGLATLSRWSFEEEWSIDLPAPGGKGKDRIAQFSRVPVPGVRTGVWVVNTHLAAKGDEAAARGAQFRRLAEEIRELEGPVVLLGDLNTDPDDAELEEFHEALGDKKMRDAAVLHGETDPTSPSEDPKRRIDYIFLSEEIFVIDLVVSTRAREASDHLPVLANLAIGSVEGVEIDTTEVAVNQDDAASPDTPSAEEAGSGPFGQGTD